MKKHYLACMIALTLSYSGSAQLMEFNFNCAYFDANDCSPFVNTTIRCLPSSVAADDWYASHGSPSINFSGNAKWGVLKAHETTGIFVGEGMYIPYSFVKGHKYQLEVIAKRVDNQTGGRMRFKAANGLTAGGTAGCTEAALPSTWDWEDIYFLSQAQGISQSKSSFLSPPFIPSKNFSRLWVYLEELYLGMSSEFHIEYLTIFDMGIEGPFPGDPAPPDNVRVTAVAYDQILIEWDDNSNNENGFHISWCSDCSSPLVLSHIYLPVNTTKYLHSGRSPETHYSYYLSSRNAAGNSFYTPDGWVEATTFADECTTDVVYDSQSEILYKTKATNSIETGNNFVLDVNYYLVIFSAGSYISFKPESKIPAGANLRAIIEPCLPTANMSFTPSASNETSSALKESSGELEKLVIYPNPSNGNIIIYFKEPISKDGYLQLSDKTSNKVYSRELLSGETEVKLDLTSVKNGIYYLHVVSGEKDIVEKIIISK